MKFKRMLCGVDFSKPSIAAFEAAVELARSLKAGLHVMHVIEPDPAVPYISLHEKALAAMNALVTPAMREGPDPRITTEVTTGNASAEILKRVRERHADLLVVGAKGLTLPEGAVFGGTAKRVMSDATCSVLAVRGGKKDGD